MVMKVTIVIMTMRIIMKIMNSSIYLRVFANNCYKIVPPVLLQELINDFAVCKHCSGILLLVQNIVTRNVNIVFKHGPNGPFYMLMLRSKLY